MNDETLLSIKYGTSDEYEESDKNTSDIVFLTDAPVIKARGVSYGGGGVPTWSGESKAFSDPTSLFKDMYRVLKKPLYMADEKCPKFDILTNQVWTKKTEGDVRRDLWVVDSKNNNYLYKMIYDESMTEFAHFTKNQVNGSLVVFKFDVIKGSIFRIHLCEEKDWTGASDIHTYKCPGWNNEANAYKAAYGIDYINTDQPNIRNYFIAYDSSNRIKCLQDCIVIVKYRYGDTQDVNGLIIPKITIEYKTK